MIILATGAMASLFALFAVLPTVLKKRRAPKVDLVDILNSEREERMSHLMDILGDDRSTSDATYNTDFAIKDRGGG